MNKNNPLKMYVSDQGELTITIGIGTLSYCFEHSPENNLYCDELKDWIKQGKVIDYNIFANDVISVLREEREDGSTIFTDLLDSATNNAHYEGSLGTIDLVDLYSK